MNTIKEQAKEAGRNTHPLFESISESTGEPVSVYVQNDMIDMFEAGVNYVLEVVKSILEDKELDVEETYNKIYAMIKELKK